MPEISSFYGIVIYMYMSEHNPPHFHVKYQGYEATVTINEGIGRAPCHAEQYGSFTNGSTCTRKNY